MRRALTSIAALALALALAGCITTGDNKPIAFKSGASAGASVSGTPGLPPILTVNDAQDNARLATHLKTMFAAMARNTRDNNGKVKHPEPEQIAEDNAKQCVTERQTVLTGDTGVNNLGPLVGCKYEDRAVIMYGPNSLRLLHQRAMNEDPTGKWWLRLLVQQYVAYLNLLNNITDPDGSICTLGLINGGLVAIGYLSTSDVVMEDAKRRGKQNTSYNNALTWGTC